MSANFSKRTRWCVLAFVVTLAGGGCTTTPGQVASESTTTTAREPATTTTTIDELARNAAWFRSTARVQRVIIDAEFDFDLADTDRELLDACDSLAGAARELSATIPPPGDPESGLESMRAAFDHWATAGRICAQNDVGSSSLDEVRSELAAGKDAYDTGLSSLTREAGYPG